MQSGGDGGRLYARKMFEDNWSQRGYVFVCVGPLEGRMGDRDVKEERCPGS